MESLFSKNDKEKYKEILDAKDYEGASATLASKNFKNNDTGLDEETKENFYTLLKKLKDFKDFKDSNE